MLPTSQYDSKDLENGRGLAAYEIIFELRKRGVKATSIAAEFNVTYSVVNNVIHGKATSFRIASYVAELLGRSVQEIWPGRYQFKPRKS